VEATKHIETSMPPRQIGTRNPSSGNLVDIKIENNAINLMQMSHASDDYLIVSRISITWLIIVGSGSDESIY
jgi:hypothetical protein